jgi:hypothetical protein
VILDGKLVKNCNLDIGIQLLKLIVTGFCTRNLTHVGFLKIEICTKVVD